MSEKMQRRISVKESNIEISVQGFSDWIEALEEVRIGRIKTRLSRIMDSTRLYSMLNELTFPSWLSRAVDLITFAMLVEFPNGLTKKEAASITGMKEDSVATYLTSKEIGLAEHLTKNDEGKYLLRASSLDWAINQLEKLKEK
ncbi:MAG: hypothetical protein GF309_01770 [Candidatus Lokiarchaeota archaeon]|nr:hypothetical protein [Candidatus Lokiarchaeota archaeon]